MPSRRRVLAATFLLAVPAAGCVSRSQKSRGVYLGSIAVRNDDDQPHTLPIRVEDGDETVFEERYKAPPKMLSRFTPSVTGRGQYTVVASWEGDEYSRDLVPAAEDGDPCVSVDWEITAGGMLASIVRSYTECSGNEEPTTTEAR